MSGADCVFPALAVFLRSLSVFAVLPLGFDLVSIMLRISLAALTALALGDAAQPAGHLTLADVLGDLFIGFLIALPAALLYHGAEWFGEIFDTLRGQTTGSLADPFHHSATISAQLCASALWCVLLTSGLLNQIISALPASFGLCPQGSDVFVRTPEAALNLILYLGEICAGIMRFCLPICFVFLAVESAFGFAAKLLPGASLCGEIFLVKLCLGFLLLGGFCDSNLAPVLMRLAEPVPELLLRP